MIFAEKLMRYEKLWNPKTLIVASYVVRRDLLFIVPRSDIEVIDLVGSAGSFVVVFRPKRPGKDLYDLWKVAIYER